MAGIVGGTVCDLTVKITSSGKSTLHDRVCGKDLAGAAGGPPQYLNDEEEEDLVRWLEGCAESLNDKPNRIFNLDESGIPLQHQPEKGVAIKGQKHVNVFTSGDKTNVTVLACVSASGYALPPMIIFNCKSLAPELHQDKIQGTICALSSSGLIDSELLSAWFHHFLEYAPSGRPLVLLLDGHSPHYNPGFIRQACENGVIVFCLPPHTTDVCQPLDVTCFHSLKTYWDQACDQYMSANPGKVVTTRQVSQLLSVAWSKAMTPCNITSGFRATGVFPVNRYAISLTGDRPRPSGTPTAALAEKQGINFMPFYSPTCRKAKFSCEEELFQHCFEEGYDLTNDCRGAGDEGGKPDCEGGQCRHKTASTWVCCSECGSWMHCVCADVKWNEARKKSFEFTCPECC